MAINSLSASSYGLSGLISQMNTQDMVEKMLSGTQAKIDKAGQKKTVLQYKQELYRDVANKLKALQSSYLSFTSQTNLLSSGFYNTMSTSITPPVGASAAFSVSASSAANTGNVMMNRIMQLATAQTSKTQANATQDVVAGLDQTVAARLVQQNQGGNATLNIRVGGKTAQFLNAPELFAGKSQSEIADIINAQFTTDGVAAQASFVNNKLQIVAADKDAHIVVQGNALTGSPLAMKMFGDGVASLSGQGTFSAEIDSERYNPSITVNLDGRQQTIRLDLNALKSFVGDGSNPSDGGAALKDSLQTQLTRAFGAAIKVDMTADGIKFDVNEKSQRFTISGGSVEMGALGLKAGVSNKLNTTLAIKDLNFATELQGNQQTFKINGVEFSYNSDASLGQIISDINNSNAGVKITYIESEDRFTIQRSETGVGTADELDSVISQSTGNLMSVLFGAKGGNNVTGQGVNMAMVGENFDLSEISHGGKFTFNMNGSDYTFSVGWRDGQDTYTKDSFAAALNNAFRNSFGVLPDGTSAVEVTVNDAGGLTVTANDINLVISATKFHKDNNTSTLGFSEGQRTLATGASTLEDAGISFGTDGGITINLGGPFTAPIDISASELHPGMTMNDVADLINTKIADANNALPAADQLSQLPRVDFDEHTAAFRVMGVDIPMEILVSEGSDGAGADNLFGQNRITTGQPAMMAGGGDFLMQTDAGKNAIFELNGVEMQRSSNSFTVDGLTFTLHSTTLKDQTQVYDPATATANDFIGPTSVSVTRDTEKIVEGMQEFLKTYNETMDYLYGLYKADATYRDYAPLTAKQKEGMSDREIEQWEEKSKEGLLRNDQNIGRIIDNMRKLMYSKPEGSNIAIYDLGITTSFYTNDGNLNAESIDKLRTAIEKDPDAVFKLFAGEGGIMEQLNDTINAAAKTSYGSPGTLVALAGSNALDTTSTIYKQIKEIDDQLSTLESRYWKEYDRYWKQYNQMEQLIQQMNNQSSWLAQLNSGA